MTSSLLIVTIAILASAAIAEKQGYPPSEHAQRLSGQEVLWILIVGEVWISSHLKTLSRSLRSIGSESNDQYFGKGLLV